MRHKTADDILIVITAFLIVIFALIIRDRQQEFLTNDALYAKNAAGNWSSSVSQLSQFRHVDIPFFKSDGYFVIPFQTRINNPQITAYACDCIKEVYLDGKLEYDRNCSPRQDINGFRLNLSMESGQHTLAVRTVGLNQGGYTYFYLDHGSDIFWWQTAFLISLVILAMSAYDRIRERSFISSVKKQSIKLRTHHLFIIFLLASAALTVISEYNKNPYSDAYLFVLRTESALHSPNLNLDVLQPDYDWGNANLGYMTKPPGAAEYPLGLIRIFFGFTRLYFVYLVKLPGLMGDMLIAYVIWSVIRERLKSEQTALLAAGLYLFSQGVMMFSGTIGKTDTLGIGLLMLALKNLDKKRSSVYLGLSIAAKQFPIFLVPWLIIRKKKFKTVITAFVIAAILFLPYLVHDPLSFLTRLSSYHMMRGVEGFTWMTEALRLDQTKLFWLEKAGIGAYILIILALPFFMGDCDDFSAAAITLGLFVVFSPVLYDQYFMWGAPFILLSYFLTTNPYALLAYFTVNLAIGTETNMFMLFDYNAIGWFDILISLTVLAFAVSAVLNGRVKIRKQKTKRIPS